MGLSNHWPTRSNVIIEPCKRVTWSVIRGVDLSTNLINYWCLAWGLFEKGDRAEGSIELLPSREKSSPQSYRNLQKIQLDTMKNCAMIILLSEKLKIQNVHVNI